MNFKIPLILFIGVMLVGCQQAYYKTMEQFGVHKREIMVDRVEDARDSQVETQEQFQSALERFSEIVNFDGGDLEEQYETLNREYEKSESKAEAVTQRINAVEDVADALFNEWETELDEYSSDKYRRIKKRELQEARSRYQQLINSMRRAESKIAPVLSAFKDQVLFLKHSLNAQAVASLKSELVGVRADVSALVKEMQKSIDASNAYIESLSQ